MDWECQRTIDYQGRECYRAFQGGFYTLWRESAQQTLSDVQAIKQAKETCKAPF